MKGALRLTLIGGIMAAVSGCASGPKPLYWWGEFPDQQYAALKGESSDPDEQILMMRASADKARGKRLALPPGFRAHLGMLYLQIGHTAAAVDLWEAEKKSFPEASPYMDRVIDLAKGAKR